MKADINTTSTTEMYDYLIKWGYSDNALNNMTRDEMVKIINSLNE